MDEMMKQINKFPNGTFLKVSWENEKIILEGKIDTIYESDNGLEDEDENYLEYYACALMVERVIKNLSGKKIEAGNLIEISIENEPSYIMLADGNVIWEKN